MISCLLLAASCGVAGPPAKEGTDVVPLEERAVSVENLPQPVPESPRFKVTDRVEVVTTMGTMVFGLYGEEAPKTVANFLEYVDAGFYDGKIFHRVIPGFMIQGGGFDEQLARAETRDPIDLEIIPGLMHTPGVISMARTSDPHSATAQFFVCVSNTPQLNGAYAAFGELEEGMDVARRISAVRTKSADTDRGTMDDVPETPIRIERVRRAE